MIHIKKGNLLNSSENIIVHQVNCRGVMGAGLAKQIKTKYPQAYQKYMQTCHEGKSSLENIDVIEIDNNRTVINLYGQESYGRNKNLQYTNYQAQVEGIARVMNYAIKTGKSVSLPFNMGCSLGNGDWNITFRILEEASKYYKYDINIYDINQ